MTLNQTLNLLFPTLLQLPNGLPIEYVLPPLTFQLFRRSLENCCVAELAHLNAPDDVIASQAADHLLNLLPRLAYKYDPDKGQFSTYVSGTLRKICRVKARRYYRTHAAKAGVLFYSRPAPGLTPYEAAVIKEVINEVCRVSDLLRQPARDVLHLAYPEVFRLPQAKDGDQLRPKSLKQRVQLCRAKAELHALLLNLAPSRPWDKILLALLPRGR